MYEKEIVKGQSVTLCWGVTPPKTSEVLKSFRIRQSQSQAGSYQQLVNINYDAATMLKDLPDPCDSTKTVPWIKVTYTFAPKFTGHYFVTAVYQVVENGLTVTKETTGSAHCRVTVL